MEKPLKMREESNKLEISEQAEKAVGQSQAPSHSPATNGSKFVPTIVILSLLALAASGTFWFMQDKAGQKEKNEKAARQEKIVPVVVATVSAKAIPFELRSIGNVTPYSMVNIVPQVGGQITRVFFTQGEYIHKGDPLFQIDPRTYQAALNQAEGNVARDEAQIEAAQANLAKDMAQIGHAEANLAKDRAQADYAVIQKQRYAKLVTEGAVSHEQSDQFDTNYITAKATIDADLKVLENATAVTRADKAAIATARGTLKADQGIAEQARIQLGWTKISSPIDGLIGTLKVYEGNVVTANTSSPLVSIAQTDPIYVSVTVPEQYLNDLRRAQKNGTLTLEAMVEGRKAEAVKGDISFMENTVNTSTGTILMRAKFANKDQKLFPGQFVDVVIKMPPAGNSVVVQSQAIVTTQQGNSVYVINQDNTVKLITVKVGQTAGGETAILEGLSTGEQVVIDGQLQLSPGAKIKIKQEDSPAKM
jgi:multidrug efflux system membrane fusion protein